MTSHRTLRAALLIAALLLAGAPHPALARAPRQAAPAAGAVDAALAQALDSAVAAGAPGAIVSVSVAGRGTWSAARGLADRAGTPMAATQPFRIASITKMFVAVVALQLVQEGWLSLDHTVEHWLPGLLPAGDTVTVRQLLRHTSGLRDYMDDAFIRRVLADPQRAWQPRELVAYGAARGLASRPGARWSYSNTNYVVLGLIVERVTGATLAHELGYRVIERLGLADTLFEAGGPPPPGLAHAYQRARDLTELDMSFAWAAGNMVSTAADLTRFAQALFGGELLGEAAMAEMTSFGPAGGPGWSRSLRYGLGLMQETLRSGDVSATAAGHTGMLGGFRTALWYEPERGIAVVAVINIHAVSATPLAAAGLAAGIAAAAP